MFCFRVTHPTHAHHHWPLVATNYMILVWIIYQTHQCILCLKEISATQSTLSSTNWQNLCHTYQIGIQIHQYQYQYQWDQGLLRGQCLGCTEYKLVMLELHIHRRCHGLHRQDNPLRLTRPQHYPTLQHPIMVAPQQAISQLPGLLKLMIRIHALFSDSNSCSFGRFLLY